MHHSSHKASPFQRLLRLILEDRRELFGSIVFALLNSLLLLAVPLAAQGLVNVSAAGLAWQPLLVLALALLIGLLFAGTLTCLRYWLAEIMMERIFSRVALRVAEALPNVKRRHLWKSGGPELMNRFFDVINIEKSWFKLVYDGPGSVLEILIGLSLLWIYGFQLFFAAAAFLLLGALIVLLAGFGGLTSSIDESIQKYRVAEWLEEMVRCQDSLLMNCRPGFWAERADRRVVSYLLLRRRHFRVLLRQVSLHYFLAAVGLAGMLGMGGYLVLKGQLSLGQLVAAELVVWSLFKATEKLLRTCEAYFDLLTGLDKIGYITDLPTEAAGTTEYSPAGSAVKVTLDAVSYSYGESSSPLLRDLTFTLAPGERVVLLGPTGAGKTTLLRLLSGSVQPRTGSIDLDQVDLRELSSESKNRLIGYYSERNELFAGTLLDNVAAGRECDMHTVRDWLMQTGGRGVLKRSVGSELSLLTSAGSTLSAGEVSSVQLGRVLLGRPRLLLLDDPFSYLSEQALDDILRNVFQGGDRATIVCTSTSPKIVASCDRVLLIDDHTLQEEGAPLKLAADPTSRMATLYPTLTRSLLALSPTGEDHAEA